MLCLLADLSKLEEWHTIKALNPKDLEWFESESESEDEGDNQEMESESGECTLRIACVLY